MKNTNSFFKNMQLTSSIITSSGNKILLQTARKSNCRVQRITEMSFLIACYFTYDTLGLRNVSTSMCPITGQSFCFIWSINLRRPSPTDHIHRHQILHNTWLCLKLPGFKRASITSTIHYQIITALDIKFKWSLHSCLPPFSCCSSMAWLDLSIPWPCMQTWQSPW